MTERLAWKVMALSTVTFEPVALYGEHSSKRVAEEHAAAIKGWVTLPVIAVQGPAELDRYSLMRWS
jgi:hypothetical protein